MKLIHTYSYRLNHNFYFIEEETENNMVNDMVFGAYPQDYITEAHVTMYERFPTDILSQIPNRNNTVLYLHSFGTSRGNRHKGYARMMLKHIKKTFKGTTLVLYVSSLGPLTNTELASFYNSEGFKLISPVSLYGERMKYQAMYINL